MEYIEKSDVEEPSTGEFVRQRVVPPTPGLRMAASGIRTLQGKANKNDHKMHRKKQ